MKTITIHAKGRLKSRTDIVRSKHRNSLFLKALQCGKCADNYRYKCPRMCRYMLRKEKQWCKVKHYAGYLFIHSGKKLITIYAEPKWLEKELLKNENVQEKVGKENGKVKV